MAASKRFWAAIAVVAFSACVAEAQLTSYGQDAVPGSTHVESLVQGYGADPVPGSSYHSTVYLLVYGHDVTPGTSTRDNLQLIVPGQSAQVLTSAGPRSNSTPAYRPRLFRRWR